MNIREKIMDCIGMIYRLLQRLTYITWIIAGLFKKSTVCIA